MIIQITWSTRSPKSSSRWHSILRKPMAYNLVSKITLGIQVTQVGTRVGRGGGGCLGYIQAYRTTYTPHSLSLVTHNPHLFLIDLDDL